MKFVFIFVVILVFHSILCDGNNNELRNSSRQFKGNILCIMIVASPSHHVWNRALMKALAKDGYNVTAASVDIDKDPTPNLHYIHLEGLYESLYSSDEPMDLLEVSQQGTVDSLKTTYGVWMTMCSIHIYKTNGAKSLFQYPNDFKFDLIIYDMTAGPSLLPFLDRFPKAPLLSVTPFLIPPYASESTGIPMFPSYIPHYALALPPRMNFVQRSYNLFIHIVDSYLRKAMIDNVDKIAREYFGPDMQYLGLYEAKTDILLVNSHPAMQQPQALLPNVIQVGGLQIADAKPLPEDMEKFISAGKNGSILFSLGTNIKSKLLGAKKIQMFINVIRRLPEYNFLWKFESDSLPPIPSNLMVKKWISQNDILAHPKIKLFLTHSGLLSCQEATWHGVPILAMPFFADQHQNAFAMVQSGVAEKLDFFTTTEEEIYNSLKNMLENPSYALQMKKKSVQFRDRPEHPLDLALFWCRYLIRHGHAQHLRSPALEMPHHVQHMWDVLLVLVALVLGAVFLTVKLLQCVIYSKRARKLKTN